MDKTLNNLQGIMDFDIQHSVMVIHNQMVD